MLSSNKVSNLQKPKQLTPEEEEERKKNILKSNILRVLTGLKTLMDKRKEQRSLAVYYLINLKYQSALIVGRQLMFSSNKIWKEFNDDYKTQFEEQYFFRTSRNKQHTEYLLDSVILCKIFIAGRKREDAVDIFDKLELPEVEELSKQPPVTNQEKLVYNELNQIYSKTCAVLLNLIQIAKAERLHEYTEKMFQKYLKFVKKYYGLIEYGTAIFLYANYLYESKMYEQANRQYEKCIEIRKKNVYNGGLIDAIVNSTICLKQLCQYELAIQRIKSAIQITKDIFQESQEIDHYYLLMAKIYFQMGDFKSAFKSYIQTYKLRDHLEKGHPKKVETQLNLIFFYKTLVNISKSPAEYLNLTEKKQIEQKRVEADQTIKLIQDIVLQREDFAKYKEFKNSKMAHLSLNITKEFFQMLTSTQIQELNVLKEKIAELTYMRGYNQLLKCTFYYERKTRDFLIEANPHLRNNGKGKIL